MSPQVRTDSFGDVVRLLVLPEPQDRPAVRQEDVVRPPIACDVRAKFRLPPLGIALGERAMFGAQVPEAAVDEYGDPSFLPADIHSETLTAQGTEIDSISDPGGMENASDSELASRIAPPLAAHVSSDGRGRGRGSVTRGMSGRRVLASIHLIRADTVGRQLTWAVLRTGPARSKCSRSSGACRSRILSGASDIISPYPPSP